MMNPNACEFVPTSKPDISEQRKYQHNHLITQIASTKQLLTEHNSALMLLHIELKSDYSILAYQMQRKENNEFPCYSQEQIDILHEKYTQQSQYYYSQYSRFNDLTSELVTLQQKLHRLLLNPQHTLTHSPKAPKPQNTPSTPAQFMDTFDGTNAHSPSSTPCNVLPPIMESDAESTCVWTEDSTTSNTSICGSEMSAQTQTTQTHTKFKFQTKTSQSDKNTAETHLNSAMAIARIGFDEHKFDTANAIGNLNNICLNAISAVSMPIIDTMNMAINTQNSSQINYALFENECNAMLDNNIWNTDIKTICDEFNEFIIFKCCDWKCIEILIDCIMSHAVCIGKPVFFGAKYSLLTQSICVSNHSKFSKAKLYDLVWSVCYDTFRKLQFGNDSDKFINVCIIIAELFNANLLTPTHILQSIFKGILEQDNISEICENDIEGIFEIFKRCHRSLSTKGNKQYLMKYLAILNEIKGWDKFQNGITRVPFMINQMQSTIQNRKY